MSYVNRDQIGLDYQSFLETETGLPCGYIAAPTSASGDAPAYPYLVVTPHAGGTGDVGRAFSDVNAGAELHFDVQVIGTIDRQVAGAIDRVLAATLNATWTASPMPARRDLVGYGTPGKDDSVGIRWSSVEVVLGVLI